MEKRCPRRKPSKHVPKNSVRLDRIGARRRRETRVRKQELTGEWWIDACSGTDQVLPWRSAIPVQRSLRAILELLSQEEGTLVDL